MPAACCGAHEPSGRCLRGTLASTPGQPSHMCSALSALLKRTQWSTEPTQPNGITVLR
jgi:hypothetical protein